MPVIIRIVRAARPSPVWDAVVWLPVIVVVSGAGASGPGGTRSRPGQIFSFILNRICHFELDNDLAYEDEDEDDLEDEEALEEEDLPQLNHDPIWELIS